MLDWANANIATIVVMCDFLEKQINKILDEDNHSQ